MFFSEPLQSHTLLFITEFSTLFQVDKLIFFLLYSQNFPQSHQLITTLNGSVPTTQTLTTTAAFNNINSSSTGSNYVVSEDEISKKLPKEILLRILSYLDVVSLCRCAQVSIKMRWLEENKKKKKTKNAFCRWESQWRAGCCASSQ
jgi:hypothetical protein